MEKVFALTLKAFLVFGLKVLALALNLLRVHFFAFLGQDLRLPLGHLFIVNL